MSFEEQLAKKEYYRRLTENAHNPIAFLGERYDEEQQKEDHDLSSIRFGQGELYFHIKDYETAMFKWGKIQNEYQSWAKKNTADAYVKLGQFSKAEELYKGIVTDSIILNTEIGLQLFALYEQSGNKEKANTIIKWVISLNPDYPTVTDLARTFYEEQQDWRSAVELAVNEGIRTEQISWFTILKSYVDEGLTKEIAPQYFEESLFLLKKLKKSHFEQLLSSLWKSYMGEDNYLRWVESFIRLFAEMEQEDHQWNETELLFNDVFFSLVSGKYFLKDIENIIPDFLLGWTKIANESSLPIVYGAILSWNDYFPLTLDGDVVEKAEGFYMRETIQFNTVDRAMKVLTDIITWGKDELMNAESVLQWEGKPLLKEGQPDISDVHEFLNTQNEDARNESILLLIRNLLNAILDKKEEQKNGLQKSIKWHEEVLLKLNGALHQLDDLQYGKNKVIKNAFQRKKEEMKTKIQKEIPEILKGCSDLLNEDYDFSKLHVEINGEMNRRIQFYFNETILPQFQVKFQEWCKKAEIEFIESKLFMDELTEGLNPLFAEEQFQLQGDFQVLNDWKRDMERMTSFFAYEEENIFLRLSPSQLLLKGAGKLLSAIPQNSGFLLNQYKKQIETEDYSEIATSIANKFLQPFVLFERTLERDIAMFFRDSSQTIKEMVDSLEAQKELDEKELQVLKNNPEKFYDPLILFQIRHRQLEWLNIAIVNSPNL